MRYEKPEVLELGKAQEAILGSAKVDEPIDNDLPRDTGAFVVDEVDE